MKILYYYKSIFIVLLVVSLAFIGYFTTLMTHKQYFILPNQIEGLVNPDTFKIKVNKKEYYITSALIKTASGNEPCAKAKKMAKEGYIITNKLLKNAQVIRYELVGGLEDKRYLNARIYIDEISLGKQLYKKRAAIKYVNNEKICRA